MPVYISIFRRDVRNLANVPVLFAGTYLNTPASVIAATSSSV